MYCFSSWNFNLLKMLYINSEKVTYSMRDPVFKEGDNSNLVYIVKRGEFLVIKMKIK